MSVKRRNHSPEFKFRTALEAAKEQKTISQLASEFNRGLDQYFRFYNNERFHQSLDYRTPTQVYYDCQSATDG